MGTLVLNGIYDLDLLRTLKTPTMKWGADLRGKSSQLVTFKDLKTVAHELQEENEMMLILEDESPETVFSFIDLIKKENFKVPWLLQFRDIRPASFYQQFQFPFSWRFNPEGDWREIISLPHLQNILLPVEFADHLTEDFWAVVDQRNLQIYLHFNHFEEFFRFKNLNKDLSLSIDLTSEVELSYRKPNKVLIQTYVDSLKQRVFQTSEL